MAAKATIVRRSWLSSIAGRVTRGSGRLGGAMSYEILIEEQESIDDWTVCTVCLNIHRAATITEKKWRCTDCGIDAGNNTQRLLRAYLTENPVETLEKNLRQWGNVKGVRVAYKMLRSARYKCLMTLGKRLQA
jgi:hypothetical protein